MGQVKSSQAQTMSPFSLRLEIFPLKTKSACSDSRFDPEKEIESLEKKDEEQRKKKQEQAKGMNKSAIPPSLELKGFDSFDFYLHF